MDPTTQAPTSTNEGNDAPACPAILVEPPKGTPKTDKGFSQAPTLTTSKPKGGKSLAKRGPTALPRNRGTGFEEYFADPPMTPEEAREEKEEIYSDDLPFEERIESCIQRFRSRRRLQGDQIRFFNEYLFLGGIDTSPAPFSGHDAKDLKELTPAEKRNLTAKDSVNTHGADERFYNGDRAKWSVNFTAIASGFFSTSLGQFTGFEPQTMDVAIGVVENFLRYVLHHDVCPEFDHDVRRALNVCKQARVEWPLLLQMGKALPGQFNLAAAQVFGVHCWDDWSFHGFEKSEVDAKVSLLTSLALIDEPEQFSRLSEDFEKHYIVKEYERTVEVTEIYPPTAEVTDRFRSLTLSNSSLSLDPVGKAKFKKSKIETDQVCPDLQEPDDELWLYFDNSILSNMLVGQKMTLAVCETDTRLMFVKKLLQVVPTFYTFLPQEMMRYYKASRPNDRPAPSIHDLQDGQNETEDKD